MTSRQLLRRLMGHAASAGSLDAVYNAALDCVQHGLGIDRASLLLFDDTGTMQFVAWSGLSEAYRRAVTGHSPWSADETDATPLLVADVETDAGMRQYAAIMTRERIRALAFIPLQAGPKLLGKFMLYYREPHAFSAEEIAAAQQIADYVIFALEHHRIAVALQEQLVSERELRRRAEAEATHRQESESRLHVALAAGQMGTWDWNLVTGRIRWSEELERMHGLERGGFGGDSRAFLQVVHPLDAERVGRDVRMIESAPQPDYESEFRIVRADGACRWLAYRGRLLRHADGAPSRMVGVCMDVTDAKRVAEAASEADRRKDDFLATLAHELRNPLAAVRIAVAVIQKANGDSETVVEYCAVMERQLRHLTRLVDDLLDVADVTRHGLPLEKARIELSAVVRAAVEQCRVLVDEAEHELSVTLPGEPVMLDADPERLVQVLTNLLSNAVKYTPSGGRIGVTVACEDAHEVRITVTDTGLGIPPDKLDSVFEMFSQLDRSLETGHKGLGIGLSLASALVSMHGGRIRAHSEGVGAGSEFSVWLPIAPTPAATAAAPADEPRCAGEAARCRVLVVDDNADVAWSTSRLLREFGHDVRFALDGADAMVIADEYRPDVVLLDIAMPKMNGYEVARTLRATPWGRAMTLVAVTGWGQDSDQRRSADAGFDRHMTKPVDPLALEAFLDSVARSPAAPAREPRSDAEYAGIQGA